MARIALGDQATLLWSDERFAWGQLNSEDWRSRFVAVMALVDVWQLDRDEVISLSKSLIDNDKHDQVVGIALHSIREACAGTFDGELSQYLAKIILSAKRSDKVRIAAYEALIEIQHPKISYIDSTKLEERVDSIRKRLQDSQNRSLELIDWEFVDQFKA